MFLIRNQVIMFIVKLAHEKLYSFIYNRGLLWWLSCKEFACNQEMQVPSLDWEDPLAKKMATCLESSMDRGAWQAIAHRVSKESGHDLVTKQQQQSIVDPGWKLSTLLQLVNR